MYGGFMDSSKTQYPIQTRSAGAADFMIPGTTYKGPTSYRDPMGFGLGYASGTTIYPAGLQNQILPPVPIIEAPPPPPVPGIGGEADRLRPRIVGASNQKANWNKIPLVLGFVGRVFPIISANAYTLFRGRKNTLHVGMDFGYGELSVIDAKIGEKKLKDLGLLSPQDYVILEGKTGDPAIGELYSNDAEVLEVQLPALRNQEIVKTCLQEADEIVVAFAFDAGLYDIATETLEDGSILETRTPYTVSFRIEYRIAGSTGAWTTAANTYDVTDETEAPFMVAYSFKPATKDVYEVRVRRTTQPGRGSDASIFYSLTAVIYVDPYVAPKDVNGNDVRIARIVLAVDASRNIQGVLEQVSAELRSKFPVWNGGVWTANEETNNPAWLAVAVLRGVNGCNPRPIPDSRIDIQSFLDFANYCAAKGYTYNRIIDQPMKIQTLVDEICRAGRARVVKKNGLYTCVIDRARTTIDQHFSRLNVVPGSFRYHVRHSLKTHAVRVNWLDPKDNNSQAQRLSYNDDFNSTSARRFEVQDFPGCTDPDNAYKYGRYMMADQELRSKSVEFVTGWQSLMCSVGSLVAINHDVSLMGIASGRIVSLIYGGPGGTISGAVVTQGCSFALNTSYETRIQCSDGSTLVVPTANVGAGEYTALQFNPAIPALVTQPQVGDLFQFGPVGASSRLHIVIAVERQSEHFARLVCQEYHSGVYTAEAAEIPDYESNATPVPPVQETLDPPVVVSVVSDERVLKILQNGLYLSQIVFTLAPVPPKVAFFEYQYKKAGSDDNWSASQFVGADGGMVTVTDVNDGDTYTVRMLSRTAYGIRSDWTEHTTTVVGKTTPPPDVTYLNMREGRYLFIGLDTRHGFDRPLDFAGVQVRMAWGVEDANSNWDNSIIMADLFVGDLFPLENFAVGDKTWFVKAVDITGRMSANAAILRETHGDLEFVNITEEEDYAPTFTNFSITGGSVVSGEIRATQLTGTGQPHYKDGPDAPYFKGAAGDSFYGDYYSAMVVEFDAVPGGITPGAIFKLNFPDLVAENYRIFFCPPNDTIHYIGNSADNYYQGASGDQFRPASTGTIFTPFPTDGIPAKRQKYRIRMEFDASYLQTRIPHAIVITDGPDVYDYLDDVVISADPAGTVLAPTKTFYSIKNVSVTLQAHPDYPDAFRFTVDKTGSIPVIHVYDVNDSPVAGLVDVVLKGV